MSVFLSGFIPPFCVVKSGEDVTDMNQCLYKLKKWKVEGEGRLFLAATTCEPFLLLVNLLYNSLKPQGPAFVLQDNCR